MGLDVASAEEPENITSDKFTQTYFEDDNEDPIQEMNKNAYAALRFVSGEEKYSMLQKEVRLAQDTVYTVNPRSEFEDFFLKANQEKEGSNKYLGDHQDIFSAPDEDEFNEISDKADKVTTVTGQILMAVAGLRDTDRTNIEAAAAMLTSVLKKQRNKLRTKVPEIIDIIYFHLQAIEDPISRKAAIGAICLLAETYPEEVILSLLSLSLPCDKHVTEIWEALAQAKQPVRLQILAKLLEMLKRKPYLQSESPGSNMKDNWSLMPLAATKALGIIFKNKNSKVPMNSFYVSVIIFLVIQLHYLVNFPDAEYGIEESLKTSSYISCTVEALKAVIKREKNSWMCFMSLAGGWDLLSSPENYLDGVLLLARAIVKHYRGLDYAVFTKVIPLLHHGDDKQKLTAMAFFTALLSSESTYTVLQKNYILGLLKNWNTDPNPTYRWLSLHGMGNVALHLQNNKEFTTLILSILQSFNDPEEKVILTAFEVITKIAVKKNVMESVKIARQLQPFLVDERVKICCAANQLFQELLKNLKDKSLMQDQVLNSIVPLLLNMQDQHPDVVKSCRESLKQCNILLGWTVHDSQDSWNITCKHLVREYPGKLRNFLYQAQDYSQNPQRSSRTVANMFINTIFEHMESGFVQKEEVDFLRQVFSSLPPDKDHSVPVAIPRKPVKVCRYCPAILRCLCYFSRSHS
ncbi:maestro heat-like repeat-containing protein family member 6 [Heteronotia binoei]|uniref:maestro heat-like repeat-containing protein family member 6 n=1 Tax=Heteronotia binoei TaxID=13085 RepID=UPI002931E4D3|nr:maestro heat-like repeat-containing protein family member 6 [Heteronotia binoei]